MNMCFNLYRSIWSILGVLLIICMKLSAEESLEEWLYTQISEYEDSFSLLQDHSDIYSAYYILGKQIAYRDVIEKLENDYPELISHAD